MTNNNAECRSNLTASCLAVLCLITLWFPAKVYAADCSQTNIELNTQAQVDSFQATYGSGVTCDTVSGNLHIEGDDIVDLTSLGDVVSVGGLFLLRNPLLTNLDGLDGLSSITSAGSWLSIYANPLLANIDGLASVTSVAGSLFLGSNASMTNVDGLSGIASFAGDIEIVDNPMLADLNGLSGLDSVHLEGRLIVVRNDSLTNLTGLSGIISVGNYFLNEGSGGGLVIAGNVSLNSLDGLSNITSVDGDLRIVRTALQNLDGLSNLIGVGKNVLVSENSKLSECAGLTKLLDGVDDGEPGPGPGLDGIPDIGNQATLAGNQEGCNSISEVMTIFRDGFESPPNTFTTVDTGLGSGPTGAFCSIAIGSNGFPVISYRDNINTTLKVAACSDVGCGIEGITISTVDGQTQMSGLFSSVAIGADGLPVIGYLEQQIIPVGVKVAKCNDAACSGGNEIVTMVVNPTAISELDLAVGNDTFPVIAFGLNGELKVAKCNDAACQGMDESVVTIDDLGNQQSLRLSLAMGLDHFPVISYYDATVQALKVAKCNDQACSGSDESIVTINDPDSKVSWGTSIAIGSDGFPVISYGSYTSNELKVAKCGDINCTSLNTTVSTVDNNGGQLALQTSIAIGVDGFPVISYQDADDGSLKVAKCNDLACSGGDEIIRTLDTGARHTSIAIGADGLPVISYCNSISNDFALKVVHCGTPSCR